MGDLKVSNSYIQIRQNSATAALLVLAVTAAFWILFNSLVDAYPPNPTTYQAPTPATSAATQKLGYPYSIEP